MGSAVVRFPDAMAKAVARFEQNPAASKPLGFYTWSPDLERIFKRDRLLQQELTGAADIAVIVEAIRSDANLRTAYAAHLDLAARLTNALMPDMPDLRGLLAAPDKAAPARGVWLFPPSRAHETDLVQRMYGDNPIPAGFSLVDEVLRRTRAGTLDLAPTATSGWYDWQTWALETLAAPKRAHEAQKLRLSPAYEAWLEDLFRGLFALTRETHVKQLVLPAPGAAARGGQIEMQPDLRVEPVPTFYLRRALAYRFVRGVLEAASGEQTLSNMRRISAGVSSSSAPRSFARVPAWSTPRAPPISSWAPY